MPVNGGTPPVVSGEIVAGDAEGGSHVFVVGFPSAMFGTNCYVLSTGPGTECVVVDPGIEVVGQLDETCGSTGCSPSPSC